MSPSIFFILLIFLPSPAAAGHRHLINIPAGVLRPSTLSWDPTAQHFVVASSSVPPTISSVSDAGIADTIVSDPLLSAHSSISSVSVDDRRRRLLVGLRRPDALAAYDLRSSRPHPRIFFSSLPSSPGGISIDSVTGFTFITGLDSGVIWKADLDGVVSDLSRSAIYGDNGLTAVAHSSKGFLIAVQGKTGRVFKVDEERGAAMEVIGRNGVPGPNAEAIALMSDGSAVFAGRKGLRMVRSGDGWAEVAVRSEAKVEEGKKCVGVAVRNGNKVYMLVSPETEMAAEDLRSRIEEVDWEEEGDLLWPMVLVGFGLAYFLYWRFQMGQLVSNMNKKRA